MEGGGDGLNPARRGCYENLHHRRRIANRRLADGKLFDFSIFKQSNLVIRISLGGSFASPLAGIASRGRVANTMAADRLFDTQGVYS